jgi:WD40 repeat protein
MNGEGGAGDAGAVGGAGGSGGSGPSGGGGGSAGANSAGSGGEATAGTGGLPVIDPAVSERYRWTECGRIGPAAARPEHAVYGADGSILVLDELGSVSGFAAGSRSPVTLIEPPADLQSFDLGMAISLERMRLLRYYDSTIEVYEAADDGPLGPGELERVVSIDRAGGPCSGSVEFSADGAFVVGQGPGRVCLWAAASGVQRSNIAVLGEGSAVVGVASADAPIRVIAGQNLATYTYDGELLDTIDLRALLSAEDVWAAVLSADAETLIAFVSPGATGTPRDVVAVEIKTATERWRTAANDPNTYALATSPDGHVMIEGGDVFRVADGQKVGVDALSFPRGTSDLDISNHKKLVVGELVADWDLTEGALSNLYGSHAKRIVALDVSRDGRTLASHGDWAVMWELEPDFAASRPVAQGKGSDSSWNVAIAPDGSGMVASGDNVALVTRSGVLHGAGAPPVNVLSCLSPDWAFSPDGAIVAGARYGNVLEIRSTQDFLPVQGVPTSACGSGVAFSPDGTLLATAGLELFETGTWTKRWDHSVGLMSPDLLTEHAVDFRPDGQEIVVTRCPYDSSVEPCASARFAVPDGASLGPVPGLEGDRARYSPEGHWLVSGSRALHVPSGSSVEVAPAARVSTFTPSGDIIAGMSDGELVRYCRSTE